MLAINGFGGNLAPPPAETSTVELSDGSRMETGGAAYLSSYLDQLRGAAPASQLYSVGDNTGSTPLESALFHDEPTMDFLDSQGLTASGIGNHDLDNGFAELRRLQLGGCHPVDGCRFSPEYAGASFPMIGSNLNLPDGLPATLPFGVSFVGSIPVGTIAITPRDLATRVTPAGVEDLTVADPLETVNRTADLLEFLGVHTIVLLLNEDLDVPEDSSQGCAQAFGPAREIVDKASPAVDVIFTGGSNTSFTCNITDPGNRPRAVVQARQDGTGVSVADVTIDKATGDVLRDRVSSFNQLVSHDITPDPGAQKLVDRALDMSAETAKRPVGTVAASLTRTAGGSGESTMGDVVADAQLAATRDAGAQIALTNPGGIRGDLDPGMVTYADLHTVQPFHNRLRTITLTGDQLTEVLEQQFPDPTTGGPDGTDGNSSNGAPTPTMLQPSAGLTYTIDASAPGGSKVRDVRVDGAPVGPADSVRVTVNAFLAEGGDGFTALTRGTDQTVGINDLDALVDYVAAESPVPAPKRDRISVSR